MRAVWLLFLIVFYFSCSSSVGSGANKKSLVKYANAFSVFDKGDSLLLVINSKQFTFSKKHQNLNVVISSSTQLTYLKALSAFSSIKGVIDENYFNDSLLSLGIKQQKIKNYKHSSSPDWEGLAMLKNTLILGYANFALNKKSTSNFNLTIIPINEFKEEHPLGKTEWIKAFGVLLGKYKEADSIFSTIEEKYNSMKIQAKKNNVKVIAGDYYDGFFWVPSATSYIANLVNDAGAEYLVKNTQQTTLQMNKETFVTLAKECDYWRKLTPNAWTVTQLKKEEVKQQFGILPQNLKAIVYCDVVKCDYFEQSILHPEKELEDLIRIFNSNKSENFYKVISVE